MAIQIGNNRILCEQCGKEYNYIGRHWSGKSCNYPQLDRAEKDMLVGLLMSDGSIGNKASKNQYIIIEMVSKQFLEWLNDEFGWLFTGVTLARSAKEKADDNKKSGFDLNAEEENYSDMYRTLSRSHPFITSLTDWYSSGEKVWSDSLQMTPTTLLMLFVGDGHYETANGNRRIKFSMINESNSESKVRSYFSKQSIPEPSSWDSGSPKWTVESSYRLFEYMAQSTLWNGAPPGFEYKFPRNFGGTGRTMEDLER